MRYRTLSPTGDYTFGQQQRDFLINSPATVGQAVLTRLLLYTGEWYLDQTDGTPWRTEVLGKYTQSTYDVVIKARILGTPGVVSIVDYSSNFDGPTRALSVTATINTIYGATTIQGSL